MKPCSYENYRAMKDRARRKAEFKAKLQELFAKAYQQVEAIRSHDNAWTRCARRLTGKPVVVRLRKPCTAPNSKTVTVGLFHRDPTGLCFIDLDPQRFPEAILETFLHECGHVLASSDVILPSSYHEKPPGSVDDSKTYVPDEKLENLADEVATYWLELVEIIIIEQPGIELEPLLDELGRRGAKYTEKLKAIYA
jgi:hypothetical protein